MLAEREHRPLRVAMFPRLMVGNPYQRLLYGALEERGAEIETYSEMSPTWARRASERFDAVHMHWLEYMIGSNRPGGIKHHSEVAYRCARTRSALRILAESNVRVVWTVHNLRSHECRYPRLELALARAAVRTADEVIVHSANAGDQLAAEIGVPRRTRVLHHPNYCGFYPPESRSREVVRESLHIPQNSYVYLTFGRIRPYKRVAEVIQAFGALPDCDAVLLVVGAPLNREIRAQIESAADGDSRVQLHLDFVGDSDVAYFHQAADAAVLNHRELFSSGALLLALSQGLPVVAPASGAASEVADGPALLSFEPGGLPAALRAIRQGDQTVRRRAALAAARRFSWDRMAEELIDCYARGNDHA